VTAVRLFSSGSSDGDELSEVAGGQGGQIRPDVVMTQPEDPTRR